MVDKIRVEVRKAQVAKNLSDEQTMQVGARPPSHPLPHPAPPPDPRPDPRPRPNQLFQTNFEHSLDQLIGAIRSSFNVTEKAMDTSFKQHQGDPEVQKAIQNMRVLSANSPAQGGASGSQATVTIPASLTRERLKEIMTFNATTLEKELRPIKEEMARQRKLGKTPQVDPQALMGLQQRISSQVQDKYEMLDLPVSRYISAISRHRCRTSTA